MGESISETYSLFEQPWWLDATAPNSWDAKVIEENGHVIARMPFSFEKRYGLRILGQPQLTQTLGPWIASNHTDEARSAARVSREHDLYGKLISGLPRHDHFQQNFHALVTNWLPFYWEGFQQSTLYSYIIDVTQDQEQTYDRFKASVKREIKKAQKKLNVLSVDGVEEVLALATKTFGRQGKPLPYSPDLLRAIDDAAKTHGHRRALLGVDEWGNVHSAAYIVGDERAAYLIVTGSDPQFRSSGSGNLVHWEAIKAASGFSKTFDFEGSMIRPVESFYRGFGPRQQFYFSLTRSHPIISGARAVRQLLNR